MLQREVQGSHRHYSMILGVEDDGSTWCHVSVKRGRKELTSSLCFIESAGGIDDDEGGVIPLAPRDLAAIRSWAEDNGY